MAQVLKETDRTRKSFDADAVHDLRVALRRCRSIGEVLLMVDPVPDWTEMRKEGKRVFSSLGELRDCQVMLEWICSLGSPDDPATQRLLEYATAQEQKLKETAADSLGRFDTEAWAKWANSLPKRAGRFRLDSEVFKGIALERWENARQLHHAAMKSRSKVALHRLRIGIKKFRYVVENLLPTLHQQIGGDLKCVQDLLGEIHDLDVLWIVALRIGAFSLPEEKLRWQKRIDGERSTRVRSYRERAMGKDSIWAKWRSLLPSDVEAERATYRRLQCWASVLDPDFAHSQRVASLCDQLLAGLDRVGAVNSDEKSYRKFLLAAAVCHDVGKRKGDGGHHKRSQRDIEKLELPYGWSEDDRRLVAWIARFHRGDWTAVTKAELGGLRGESLKRAQMLGGILRLANSLDHAHDGTISKVEATRSDAGIVIYAQGLKDNSRLAERAAAARHLLELSCGIPILVRGA